MTCEQPQREGEQRNGLPKNANGFRARAKRGHCAKTADTSPTSLGTTARSEYQSPWRLVFGIVGYFRDFVFGLRGLARLVIQSLEFSPSRPRAFRMMYRPPK